MEQFFLFMKERPKQYTDGDSLGMGWSPRRNFVYEKTVNTIEEVIQWIKDIHMNYEHMVVKGEEVKFGTSEKIIVDVWKK